MVMIYSEYDDLKGKTGEVMFSHETDRQFRCGMIFIKLAISFADKLYEKIDVLLKQYEADGLTKDNDLYCEHLWVIKESLLGVRSQEFSYDMLDNKDDVLSVVDTIHSHLNILKWLMKHGKGDKWSSDEMGTYNNTCMKLSKITSDNVKDIILISEWWGDVFDKAVELCDREGIETIDKVRSLERDLSKLPFDFGSVELSKLMGCLPCDSVSEDVRLFHDEVYCFLLVYVECTLYGVTTVKGNRFLMWDIDYNVLGDNDINTYRISHLK